MRYSPRPDATSIRLPRGAGPLDLEATLRTRFPSAAIRLVRGRGSDPAVDVRRGWAVIRVIVVPGRSGEGRFATVGWGRLGWAVDVVTLGLAELVNRLRRPRLAREVESHLSSWARGSR